MNTGQRSVRRAAAIANASLSPSTLCTTCLHRLSRHQTRHAASAAAAIAPDPEPYTQPPVTHTGPQKAYRVLASTVLSRPPLLTRDLTSFEKAFYLYQKRLNERLALPFTRYFYYKKGTPADEEWKRKARVRKGTAARDIGVYSGYGEEAWNDEVLVGDRVSEPESQVRALLRDAEGKDIAEEKLKGDEDNGGEEISGDARTGEGARQSVGQQVAIERPHPRVTEADRSNDLQSLDRKLDRSLYLLIKNKDGRWRFPEDRVYGRENLSQAAERLLIQSCGINMNTWIVANHPIGHFSYNFPTLQHTSIPPNHLVSTSHTEAVQQDELGEKVFFMKGRMMAGQADLSKNEYGDQDFRWLAKEEVEAVVTRQYWSSVRNMLTER